MNRKLASQQHHFDIEIDRERESADMSDQNIRQALQNPTKFTAEEGKCKTGQEFKPKTKAKEQTIHKQKQQIDGLEVRLKPTEQAKKIDSFERKFAKAEQAVQHAQRADERAVEGQNQIPGCRSNVGREHAQQLRACDEQHIPDLHIREEQRTRDSRFHDLQIQQQRELEEENRAFKRGRDEEIREFEKSRSERAVQRCDYEIYRTAFDEEHTASKAFLNKYHAFMLSLTKSIEELERLKSATSCSSRIKQIKSLFKLKYPGLLQRLDQDFATHLSGIRETFAAFEKFRDEQGRLHKKFGVSAHMSRELTRFHRMNKLSSRYDTIIAQSLVAIDLLCELQVDLWCNLKDVDKRIKREGNNEILSRSARDMATAYTNLSEIINILTALSRISGLDASLEGPLVEKKVLAASPRSENLLHEASQIYRKLGRPTEISVSEHNNARAKFRDMDRTTRGNLQKLRILVCKRSLLEESLGEVDAQEVHEVDRVIRERLASQDILIRGSLAKLGVKVRPRARGQTVIRAGKRLSSTISRQLKVLSPTIANVSRKARIDRNSVLSLLSLYSDNFQANVHSQAEEKTSILQSRYMPTKGHQLDNGATSPPTRSDNFEICYRRGPGVGDPAIHLEPRRRRERKRQRRLDERLHTGAVRESMELRSAQKELNFTQGLRLTPTGSKQAEIPSWVKSAHTSQLDGNSSSQKHDSTTTEPQPSVWSPEAPQADSETPLKFQISPFDYRNAMKASKNSTAAYWTYKLYKNSAGETPLIHYCQKFEQAQEQARRFLDEPVLGFDLEWEPNSKAKTIKQNVSLIQIAAENKIGLFHIARFVGDRPDDLMPPALRDILESDKIIKAGVNVASDSTRLSKWLGLNMKGLFELSHLYKVVNYSHNNRSAIDKKPLKLAEQVQQALLLPMKKDDVRVSNWSKRLNLQQIEYSASDAYAGYQLYHTLESKRKEMLPRPPRPALWEAQQPLVLGDGTVLMRRSKRGMATVRDKAAEDEELGEEFFNAVEVLDPYNLGETNLGASNNELACPTLPKPNKTRPSACEENEPNQPGFERDKKTTLAPSNPRGAPSLSHEVARADGWATSYLSSLPEGKAKCRAGVLRTWHLWYEQGFDIKVIATLARDPPLSQITVASYILEAVKQENLPFHAQKIRQAFDLIPSSISHKYRKVLDRLDVPS